MQMLQSRQFLVGSFLYKEFLRGLYILLFEEAYTGYLKLSFRTVILRLSHARRMFVQALSKLTWRLQSAETPRAIEQATAPS